MAAMKTHQPPITSQQIDAFAASALDWLGWILGAVLRLGCAGRSRRLKRFVESLERAVEAIIFLKAAARLTARRRPRRPVRLNAPSGFRAMLFRRRRLLFKHARICDRRVDLYQRVLRAIAALARPELYVSRFVARLRRGLCGSILIPSAPPARAILSAPPPRVAITDTS
jgi:hypothetical protein